MNSEHLEQAYFVSWFRKNYMPKHRIFAIPNGGYRSKSAAMALKVEGVSPGVPDLFIPSLKIFIEMKREKGGTVSLEQKDWIAYLESVGYTCIIAYGFEDAKTKVFTFLN